MKGDILTLQQDVSSMKSDMVSMKGDISALQHDVGAMKNNISTLEQNYDSLQAQVAQNTLLLEGTRKDIKIIIEVQKANFEQNQREHQEIITTMNNRADIIELAVKSTSTTVNEIIEDNKSFNEILGRHERSMETFKRKLAKTL
ncbi:MAG: hypothetical protein GX958_05655 [Desulfitobacterium sp.]|nr:hypothetical protein [Desulfitobacterium sp.]